MVDQASKIRLLLVTHVLMAHLDERDQLQACFQLRWGFRTWEQFKISILWHINQLVPHLPGELVSYNL